MWKSVCHSIIIKKNLYDIVSADAQFYSFMGNRLYSPFNELIGEKNRDSFYEHAAAMDGKWFAAELKVDERFNLPVLMSIVQGNISEYICVSLYIIQFQDFQSFLCTYPKRYAIMGPCGRNDSC